MRNELSSNGFKTAGGTNYHIAKKVLPVFQRQELQKGRRHGWILMDYFEHQNVDKIIDSNMEVVDYELTVTFDEGLPAFKPEELTYTLYARGCGYTANEPVAVYTQKDFKPVKEGDHYKITFEKLPVICDVSSGDGSAAEYEWYVEFTNPGFPEYDTYQISRERTQASGRSRGVIKETVVIFKQSYDKKMLIYAQWDNRLPSNMILHTTEEVMNLFGAIDIWVRAKGVLSIRTVTNTSETTPGVPWFEYADDGTYISSTYICGMPRFWAPGKEYSVEFSCVRNTRTGPYYIYGLPYIKGASVIGINLWENPIVKQLEGTVTFLNNGYNSVTDDTLYRFLDDPALKVDYWCDELEMFCRHMTLQRVSYGSSKIKFSTADRLVNIGDNTHFVFPDQVECSDPNYYFTKVVDDGRNATYQISARGLASITWLYDANNMEKTRPASVPVTFTGTSPNWAQPKAWEVTLDSANVWRASTAMPLVDEKGETIHYTVSVPDDCAPGYTYTIQQPKLNSGEPLYDCNLVFSLTKGDTGLTGKVYYYSGGFDPIYPYSDLVLYAIDKNGKKIKSTGTTWQDNQFTLGPASSFPKENGPYTVTADPIPGFDPEPVVKGYDIAFIYLEQIKAKLNWDATYKDTTPVEVEIINQKTGATVLTRMATPNETKEIVFDQLLPVCTDNGEIIVYTLRINGQKDGVTYDRYIEGTNTLVFSVDIYGEVEIEIPLYIVMEGADAEELLKSTDTLEFDTFYGYDRFYSLQSKKIIVGFSELTDPTKPLYLHFTGYFPQRGVSYVANVTQKPGTSANWQYELGMHELEFYVENGEAHYNSYFEHDLTFTNKKLADPAMIDLTATHTINNLAGTGVTPPTADFSFVLKNTDDAALMYANVTGEGTVTFRDLTFTEPGVYRYKASQVYIGDERFVCDTTVIDYEVTVKEESEKLVASVKANKVPQFISTYAVADVKLAINKQLQNTATADVDFVFNTYSGDKKLTATLKGADIAKGKGQTMLEGLSVDAPGTYKFVVSEQPNKTDLAWEYDPTTREYTVTVTRAKNGTLSAQMGTVPAAFYNEKAPTTTKVTIEWLNTDASMNAINGVLPDSVKVCITRVDGTVVQTKEITQADGWKATFDNLPRFELVNGNRQLIDYMVEAEGPVNFFTTVDGRFEDGYVVAMHYRHHKWSYRAEGNRIIATCADGKACSVENATMYLELRAEDMIFNAKPYPETNLFVDGWADVWEILEGAPYKLGFSTGKAPTAIGAYDALLSCGDAVARDRFAILGTYITVSGTIDWVDGVRPSQNQPTVYLLRNDELYGNPVQAKNYEYSFENLSYTDENNVPYKYSIVAELPNQPCNIVYAQVEQDADTHDVIANATIYPVEVELQANLPVRLELRNTDPKSDPDVFQFILEGKTDDGLVRQIIKLRRENSFMADFTLLGGMGKANSYSFTIHQVTGEKNYWIYDDHVAEVKVNIRYIDGRPVAQVDMGKQDVALFTNTRITNLTDIPVTVIWHDAGMPENVRPSEMFVELFSDGTEVQKVAMSAAREWKFTYLNMAI